MPDSENRPHNVPGLDPVAAERWRQRTPHASPWLHEEVATRMLDRLDCIRDAPQTWVHWSPLMGGRQGHQLLTARYPQAAVWLAGEQVEQAAQVLSPSPAGGWAGLKERWLGRRPSGLPVWRAGEAPQADMVWANMALHVHPQPGVLLAGWRDMLRIDGFLMFSALGPDSLKELRELHQQQGWAPAMHPLTDMHDWGDMLVELGWAEPVVDMERLTLTYPNALRLLEDLRQWGRNLSADRTRGLKSRAYRQAWLDAAERHWPRNADGQLQLTLEVIYGHAFRPRPRLVGEGTQSVSLEDMRAMLKQTHRSP